MDSKTLEAYSKRAQEYSQDWLSQPEPTDMYRLIKKFFHSKGKTADIGCGNGRDASWMNQNGYVVSGYDSSKELLDAASSLYPGISFSQGFFPDLADISDQFDNVLCETVIMHLPKEQIPRAIQSLKRVLKKEGILYLSWRVTVGEDLRHADGRLYSAFDQKFVLDLFNPASILHFEDKISASSGKQVSRLVYQGGG